MVGTTTAAIVISPHHTYVSRIEEELLSRLTLERYFVACRPLC